MSIGSHKKTFCKKYVAVIARCRMQYYGKYSPSFSYFANEKQGEYLWILREATCSNYFVVKCFFKSNMERVFLLTFTYLLQARSQGWEDFPLPDSNKFTLPTAKNMAFLILCFKLQNSLFCLIFM